MSARWLTVLVTGVLGAVLAVGLGGQLAAADSGSLAVSITDDAASAHPGQVLTYQSTVANTGSTDTQVLLEITIPDGAKVNDAGGGTIRQSLIDYGVTVAADAQVTERFVLTLGSTPNGQQRVDTVASIHLLGAAAGTASTGSAGTTAATLQATDSDQLLSSGAAKAADDGPLGPASSVAAGPAHRGWWIAALVAGAVLVLGGLWLTFRSGSDGRRRRRAREAAPHALRPVASASIGSHQARRPAR